MPSRLKISKYSESSLGLQIRSSMLFKSVSSYLHPIFLPLLGSAIIVALLCRRTSRMPKKFIKRNLLQADHPVEYNLQSVNVPRLNGWKLRLYAKLSTTFFGQLGFVSYLFKKANFDFFRNIHYVEQPSFVPNPASFDGPVAVADAPAHHLNLDSYIESAKKNEGFHFFSISDYYHAYRNKSTNPSEVAEWVMSMVEQSNKMNPPLCAVTQMNKDCAMKMAKASYNRFRDGQPLSIIDGIPVLLKECFTCAPYHTRSGTMFAGETPEKEDCTIVKKLKEAGAVVIGMTNMHELGMSVMGYNIHPDHGMPRNPYDTEHFTGGSSSGSSAAVAAGLVPVAIGTDGGGSIRVPSALCGNVGLKPTFGRVSFGGNEVACHSVVHAGPICTNVTDTALIYALLAGPDSSDPLSLNQPRLTLPELNRPIDLSNIRLGIDWEFFKDSKPEIVKICETAVEYLKSKGAQVVDVHIPELQETRIAHTLIIFTEMRENFDENYAEYGEKLNPENQSIFEVISKVTARDYITANKQRTRTIHFLKKIFEDVDVLITPACAVTAPKIQPGDTQSGIVDIAVCLEIAKYMLIGNLTGVPGLVLPVGYDGEGLPVALQIMGNWWQEDMVLSVGKAMEGMLNKQKPKLFFACDKLPQ